MTAASTLFYPVWISPNRRAGGWSWGQPCDTPQEATRIVEERIRAGASLGCVVEMKDGEKTPIIGRVKPESARRLIRHWEDLWEATEDARPNDE